MYATQVRSFSRSLTRMNAHGAGSAGGFGQWMVYFVGVTAVMGVFGGIFYKMNETNTIKETFRKSGVNQKKVEAAKEN